LALNFCRYLYDYDSFFSERQQEVAEFTLIEGAAGLLIGICFETKATGLLWYLSFEVIKIKALKVAVRIPSNVRPL